MEALKTISLITAVLFAMCYAHQTLYIPVSWFKKKKAAKRTTQSNRYAVLICARNEENVIGDIIESIKAQSYPQKNTEIFVMADNCEDRTASIALNAGAHVYTRYNGKQIGKGYALEKMMENIKAEYPNGFDGYFVFDADNILAKDYIEQMDRVFCEGNDIVTGYRNSKNHGDNWISAGSALWFLRESRYLNLPRYLLNTSCIVSGTGFLFSKRIAEEMNGWPFHMLTEDIEFSAHFIAKGESIAFCKQAELFDEQPTSFKQSWHQRMRWSRGNIEVFFKYSKKLAHGIMNKSFACFDIAMSTMPALILSVFSVILSLVYGLFFKDGILISFQAMAVLFLNMYSTLFAVGAITTVSEWKRIHTTAFKKIIYTFTFPVFMMTYIPIAFVSLFYKTDWKPIHHTVSIKTME